MSDHPKFWSDDFDTDLLKVFPDAPKMLHDPERVLWTVGSTTLGRLNHPAVWNTHGAYLWTSNPNLPRNEHGWFNVHGCVGNCLEVECTWLEWLRDAWVHSFGTIVLPGNLRLPPAPQGSFMAIMYDIRKQQTLARNVDAARRRAIEWIIRCDAIMEKVT